MGITRQKNAIEQVFEDSPQHLTAEEVFFKVRETTPNISLATIYRHLNTMADRGELTRLTFPDGKCRFDKCANLWTGHAYCQRCRQVFDLDPASLKIEPQVSADPHFQISGCEVILKGLCSNCQAQGEEPLET